jgi:hypothetical protein
MSYDMVERSFIMNSDTSHPPTPQQQITQSLEQKSDDLDFLLSPLAEKNLDENLMEQCAFLHRVFKDFTSYIEGETHKYIPVDSYTYAFKSMEMYRASYMALHAVNATKKKIRLTEKMIRDKE